MSDGDGRTIRHVHVPRGHRQRGAIQRGGTMRTLRNGILLGTALAVTGLLAATAGASTPAGDAQANRPRVTGDASSDAASRFPTNKQNEPTIALNPQDHRFLIAGANDEQDQPPCGPGPVRGPDAPADDCSFFPGVGTDGIYTSANGGASWTNVGLIDDQAAWRGAGVVSDGDPVIAYGPKPGPGGFSWANGVRTYYSSLATVVGGKGFEYIQVSTSDDNGSTWSAPVIAST